MKKVVLFSLFAVFAGILFAQPKPAYVIYNNKGEQVDYGKMLSALKSADIVFFGELHNNPIAHWLELQVAKDLYAAKKKDLIIGAEMFEADNQLIIDEYFEDLISKRSFEEECRLWPNYKTDYKPILEFAKKNKIKLVATNIPRRYASMVAKGGFDALKKLSPEAKKYIAPLPINYDPNLACYKNMLKMSGHIKGMMGPAMNPNLPKAQAIKDATMAHFILSNLKPGKLFYHFNGSYHSDNYQGIVWYIKTQDKTKKVVTISTVQQDDLSKIDEDTKSKADYIIVVPEDMTTTY
jgi:uncharacterized iron-regulated protein